MRKAINSILCRFGYVIAKDPGLIGFLKSRNVGLVLDVGANAGQFARSLRRAGYQGQIVSFEPVKETYRILAETMRGDSRWEGRNYALGEVFSTEVINVSRNSAFSSILPQTAAGVAHDPSTGTSYREEIEVRSLDEIFSEFGTLPTFLKIDTQGFEEAVLRGAEKSLPMICGLQIELPIHHLYEGTWTLSEAFRRIEAMGFVPAQIHPVSTLNGDANSWTEMDCTFRRVS